MSNGAQTKYLGIRLYKGASNPYSSIDVTAEISLLSVAIVLLPFCWQAVCPFVE